MNAPTPPAATPVLNQRLRRASPRVAAAMMPMKSAASRDSRKTMRAIVNIVVAVLTIRPPRCPWQWLR